MTMKTFKFALRPLSPFGTPLAGDTLFGHLCWALRERRGEGHLAELLEGYTSGQPFVVLSDGFPQGFVPRPTAPDFLLGMKIDPAQRKMTRTHRWLAADGAGEPIRIWLEQLARSDASKTFIVSQNTINRFTGTTGADQFAPRQVDRTSFKGGLEIYAVLDEERLSAQVLHGLLEDIGLHGYGRDATTGLGKFAVMSCGEHLWPLQESLYWLTLAPCAPNSAQLDAEFCYYLPVTRFGRHGNMAVTLGSPFKSPLLMTATGALLKSLQPSRWAVHGRGVGGSANPISRVLPATVHQGYAPVLPLNVAGSA
jgi:CRISPR-associated protein Csm4